MTAPKGTGNDGLMGQSRNRSLSECDSDLLTLEHDQWETKSAFHTREQPCKATASGSGYTPSKPPPSDHGDEVPDVEVMKCAEIASKNTIEPSTSCVTRDPCEISCGKYTPTCAELKKTTISTTFVSDPPDLPPVK
ncbi:hypothetical protein RB195_010706 [Necator americanus]|uniref:Uncharacterized protein n=1 Tax=Necator americanus TaxID=51031 RepID=A0ABR1D2E3_NECAM